ncbi:MAG: hypothetical protein AAB864_01485 [Patescibacteria group bacterium]
MLRVYIPVSLVAAVLFFGIIVTGFFNLYDSFPLFDKVLHLAGGFAVAWLAHALFRSSVTHLSPVPRIVFIAGVVALVGVAWEIAEFLSNRAQDVFPLFYRYFHGGGLADTLADMTTNVIGALIYSVSFGQRS